jgi:hypothetical protein
MTPKEKAEELVNKMYQVDDVMGNYPMCFDTAKQCAIIALDKILDVIDRDMNYQNVYAYFLEVKQEIEKL